MIFITGDVHNSIDFVKFIKFEDNLKKLGIELTRNDYIIVAGDFGIPWYKAQTLIELGFSMTDDYVIEGLRNDKDLIKYLDDYPCTILFLDGNHENFEVYDNLIEIEKFENKVGILSDNIFHLKRGNIYNINNTKIFTFGGAKSIDKKRRTERLSWWKREIPNKQEFNNGFKQLEKSNFDVDFVITHTAPKSIIQLASANGISPIEKINDPVADMLEIFLKNNLKFKKWFVGHFHEDAVINEKFRFIYDDFFEISCLQI